MARKASVYIDTGAFISFLDRSDSFHTLYRYLFSDPPELITSALVIAEGHGWFLRRFDVGRAQQFLAFIRSLSVLRIEAFSDVELTRAAELAAKFKDQALTLADAHGLSIIRARKISECWSTDRHLTLTGAKLPIKRR